MVWRTTPTKASWQRTTVWIPLGSGIGTLAAVLIALTGLAEFLNKIGVDVPYLLTVGMTVFAGVFSLWIFVNSKDKPVLRFIFGLMLLLSILIFIFKLFSN